MRRNLKDMVTVITGASSGIGRALAVNLSARGGRLALGARRLDRLQELSKEIGPNHAIFQIDVSRPENCHRIISETVEKFGRIDTVVCNAGFGFARALDAMSEEEIRQIFDTNLFGTIECCRKAIAVMKKQELRDGYRGQLMIVSSACARRGLPYFSAYAATKAAQLSLAEGLRIELKPFGIAVTSVHPVLCETEFFSTADDLSGMSPAALAEGAKQTPQRVADRMVHAIEKPCRELWPKAMSRMSLNIAVMLPAVVDRVMGGIRDRLVLEHENRGKLKLVARQAEPSMTEMSDEEAHPVT
jgi:short-subunit dehydrogenase